MFRTWRWRAVTISAVHLGANLPNLRLNLHRTGFCEEWYEVVYDCMIPEYAGLVASEGVVHAMLAQGLSEFEIQGRDVLVVLRNLPDDRDPNEYTMSTVKGLAAVLSRSPRRSKIGCTTSCPSFRCQATSRGSSTVNGLQR